jgi:hypothetical protein
MKLFKSPKGSTEQERALHREKLFAEEHGKLQTEWYARLISSGMDVAHVHLGSERRDSGSFDDVQADQFNNQCRWTHKADISSFGTSQQSKPERNKQIWWLHSFHGLTNREIGERMDIDHKAVERILDRCRANFTEDTRNGLLAAENDTKQEQAEWRRLQALKEKHLKLVRSGQVGAAIVDKLIDSGHLIRLPIDTDAADALNEATAQLALAFAAGE